MDSYSNDMQWKAERAYRAARAFSEGNHYNNLAVAFQELAAKRARHARFAYQMIHPTSHDVLLQENL